MVEQGVGEGTEGVDGVGEQGGQLAEVGVGVRARGFDESVGAEGEDGAGRQGDLGAGAVCFGIGTQQRSGRQCQDGGVLVGVAQEGLAVSGGGQVSAVVGDVEVCVRAAGEQIGVEVTE